MRNSELGDSVAAIEELHIWSHVHLLLAVAVVWLSESTAGLRGLWYLMGGLMEPVRDNGDEQSVVLLTTKPLGD